MSVTRRSVLLGAVAVVAVAGCRDRKSSDLGDGSDPADRLALEEAHRHELELVTALKALERTDIVTRKAPILSSDRLLHETHLSALAAALERQPAAPQSQPVSSSAGPSPVVPTLSGIGTALRSGVPRLQALAVAASDGDVAALLASVAAGHAATREIGR